MSTVASGRIVTPLHLCSHWGRTVGRMKKIHHGDFLWGQYNISLTVSELLKLKSGPQGIKKYSILTKFSVLGGNFHKNNTSKLSFQFFLSRCHLFLLLRGQIVIRLMATIYYAHFKKEIRSLGVSGQFWWLFEKFGTKIKSLHKSKDLNNFPNIPPFLSL